MASMDIAELDRYQDPLIGEISYAHIERKRAQFEHVLNVLGYIPCVSSPSGIVRGFYGLILVVTSCVAAIFVSLADRFTKNASERGLRTMQHLSYAVHGIENMFRGFVELLPFVVNNLALIAYDLSVDRHEYAAEKAMRV